MRRPHALLLLVTFVACSDHATATRDADTGPASDVTEPASDVDADVDAGPATPEPCASLAPLDTTFPLVPGGPATQIHAATAFDGSGIWLAYNIPPASGDGFEVWLTRLGCDGAVTHPPIRLDTGEGLLAVEPQLAIGHDRLLVAWQVDDRVSTHNLSIRLRAVGLDGTPLDASDRRAMLRRGGADHVGNAWMPALAPTDAGFLLGGSWGHEDAPEFQVFLQQLDPGGNLVGEAFDLALDPDARQLYVSTTAAGGPWTAGFMSTATDAEGPVVVTEDDTAFTLPDSTIGTIAFDPNGDRRVAAVDIGATPGSAIAFTELGADVPSTVVVGDTQRTNHSPSVSLDPTGDAALVGWYAVRAGFSNDISVAVVRRDAQGRWHEGDTVAIPLEEAAAPYSLALTAIGNETWLVSWTEGRSPDLRLFGRFVAP